MAGEPRIRACLENLSRYGGLLFSSRDQSRNSRLLIPLLLGPDVLALFRNPASKLSGGLRSRPFRASGLAVLPVDQLALRRD